MSDQEKESKKRMTFTKWAVTLLLLISVIDVQLCFYLAYEQKSIPETLAVAIVTEIIAVASTYMTKAYFESKEEEKNKLIRELQLKNEKLKNVIEDNHIPLPPIETVANDEDSIVTEDNNQNISGDINVSSEESI